MVDRIDMALDDIIKAGRKSRGGGGGGGTGRKFDNNRRPGRGGGGGGGGGFRNGRADGILQGRNRGGVSKASNYSRGDVNRTWKHDMLNDFGGRVQRSGPITMGATKLMLSNLDVGVSDSDIQELFSEFGILKSAAVHYNRSGRSLGTADVVFERRVDALKAMKQYNGVPLDGCAMNIQLVTSEISSFRNGDRGRLGSGGGGREGPNRWNTNVRVQNRMVGGGRGGGAGAGGGRRGRGGGGAARGRRPVPTVEELDAELDAYKRIVVKNL